MKFFFYAIGYEHFGIAKANDIEEARHMLENRYAWYYRTTGTWKPTALSIDELSDDMFDNGVCIIE